MKKTFVTLLFIFLTIEIFCQINMTSTGSVGIGGITSPIEKLHVNGDIFIPYSNSYWLGNNGDASFRLRMLCVSGNGAYIDYYPGLYFRSGSTSSLCKAILNGDGDFILGTSTFDLGAKLNLYSNSYDVPPLAIKSISTTDNSVVSYTDVSIVGSYSWGVKRNGSMVFYVKGDGSYISGSDIKFKQNIKNLTGALDIIKNLRGVRYTPKPIEIKKENELNQKLILTDDTSQNRDTAIMTDAQLADLNKRIMSEPLKEEIGLIANEVEKYLPEVVETQPDSTKGIAYERIIPVLIEAIKELNNEVETLKSDTKLKSAEVPTGTENINQTDKPLLEQNDPNPFNSSTTINFYIPQNSQKAAIYIYDMQGLQRKVYNISTKGKSEITIYGSELKAGMYLYTLIVDNKEVDTKKMILTQ